MGKWIAGIVGAIITGAVLWLLTNALFPRWLGHPPPPPPEDIRVECSANPATVSPGGVTEIAVKITRGSEPLEGAAVELRAGGGSFSSGTTTTSGHTYSGGVFRAIWRAPSPSAAGYILGAYVDLAGLRTDQGQLQDSYSTNCEILVNR